MSKNQSFIVPSALIIKKKNIFETDQMVTFISPTFGKITCLAKGNRRLHSKKMTILQSGNLAKIYLIKGKNLLLLTQAESISSLDNNYSLHIKKNILQFLEILDQIMVEQEIEHFIYDEICIIRDLICQQNNLSLIRSKIKGLLLMFGFNLEKEGEFKFLSGYIAYLTNKPLKSFAFLTI